MRVFPFHINKYVKIISVVGEYAGGHGFQLPNPVSIHREYPRLRLRVGWCMLHCLIYQTRSTPCGYRHFIKNEDTWYETLGHYDAESDSTLRVFEGWWYG